MKTREGFPTAADVAACKPMVFDKTTGRALSGPLPRAIYELRTDERSAVATMRADLADQWKRAGHSVAYGREGEAYNAKVIADIAQSDAAGGYTELWVARQLAVAVPIFDPGPSRYDREPEELPE